MVDFNGVMPLEENISDAFPDQKEIDMFASCCDGNNLYDAPAIGQSYTCSNNQKSHRTTGKYGPNRTGSFSNQIVLNSSWSLMVDFKPPGLSDHCSLWLNIRDGSKSIKKQFKILNVWSQHPECIPAV